MSEEFTLERLQQEVNAVKSKLDAHYERMCILCYRRMLETTRTRGEEFYSYSVPTMIDGSSGLGHASRFYSCRDAIYFIVNWFRKRGFEVLYKAPKTIYISWMANNQKKEDEITRFLIEENSRTVEMMGSKLSITQREDVNSQPEE